MKIAYVVNNAAFFVSHRLAIARAAIKRGDKVILITGRAGSHVMEAEAIRRLADEGIEHVVCAVGASRLNPVAELWGFLQIGSALRKFDPEIVHCVSPKGILYGGLAARATRCRGVVFAVSGLGFLYTPNPGFVASLVRAIYGSIVRLAYRHRRKRVLVQNSDDLSVVVPAFVAAEDAELIPGSGVDLLKYDVVDLAGRENMVLFPARLLRDKGVVEFLQAAEKLKADGSDWQFVIAGAGDYENPTAVSTSMIMEYQDRGAVQWVGYAADMCSLYSRARIVCLPSYREGMPKSLLEAAAAGCAVVTTDVPGCRDAIIPGVTGDLVRPKDSEGLAITLQRLIADAPRMRMYGERGREMARARFDIGRVVSRHLDIYDELATHSP